VRLGDRPGDVEPEAAPGHRGAGDAAEPLEDLVLVRRRDPGALIGHLHRDVPVRGGGAHLHERALRRVLGGVVDHVRQDLAKTGSVAVDGRKPG
jgi:hypothetical protein